MPKINVYLPDALADQVRAADIPVSAICQQALEREVRQMNARKAATEETRRAAERIAATRTVSAEGDEEESVGWAAGVSWARESASYDQLRELAGLGGAGWEICPVPEQSYPDLHRRMTNWSRQSLPDGSHQLRRHDLWSRGFVAGCGQVWAEIELLI